MEARASLGGLEPPVLEEQIRYGSPEYCTIQSHLIEEAWLLDHDLLDDWLQLLHEDVTYFLPVRQTRSRHDGTGFDSNMGHLYEDLGSITMRVKKVMTSKFAFSEDPPSRIRRHITNVRAHRTATPDVYFATSSVLLTRNRWDEPTFDVLAAERHDVIHVGDDGLRLVRRVVLLDQVTLGTPNLPFFI